MIPVTRIAPGGATKVAPVAQPAIAIVSRGAQGPPGGTAFEHVQPSPAAEWIINHNLGLEPNVEVLSVGGAVVDADVLHVSTNQVRVYFASAQAGRARCL